MLVVIQLTIKNLLQMPWRTEIILQHSLLILELYAGHHLRNFIKIGKVIGSTHYLYPDIIEDHLHLSGLTRGPGRFDLEMRFSDIFSMVKSV